MANKKAKRGRPATGHDPMRSIRISDDLWRAAQKKAKRKNISVNQAIREFLQRWVQR